MEVDGAPVPFAGLIADHTWVAVGTVGEVQITITARRVAPDAVHLHRLDDPVTELAD